MDSLTTMNASSRVFSILEILDYIFSCIRFAKYIVPCTRVCKGWKEIALDHVWRYLPSLAPLLSILCPYVIGEGDEILRFTRPLSPTDWERLRPYARRVKALTFFNFQRQDGPWIGENIFRQLALSHHTSPGPILPNLVSLNMPDSRNTSSFVSYETILHDNIRTLYFSITVRDIEFSRGVLERISTLCPRLLRVSIHASDENFDPSILRLLPNFLACLPNLEDLTVSSYMLSPDLLLCLGKSRHLRKIRIKNDTWFMFSRVYNIRNFQKAWLGENMFPQLGYLGIQGELHDLGQFFAQDPPPLQALENLCIYKDCYCDAPHLQSLLQCLWSSKRRLRQLHIQSTTPYRDSDLILASEIAPITKDILFPLSRFAHLTRFSLTHAQPIDMDEEELVDIISRCGNLRSLELNARPRFLGPTSLTLSVIEKLAKSTKLHNLELYVDASDPEAIPKHTPAHAFTGLDRLFIALSPICGPMSVVAYLGQLLPSSCKLDFDTGCRQYPLPEDGRCRKWRMVKEGLHSLTRILERTVRVEAEMKEIRAGMDAREEEIRALRSQNKELRERVLALESQVMD